MIIDLAIATFHRNAGLQDLLAGIAQMRRPPDVYLRVHVVDNSWAKAALPVVHGIGTFPVPIRYTHQPKQGLASVRNTALAEAIAIGATHLAFLDDDERPSESWLEAHVDALKSTGAAATMGAVHARFLKSPPKWIKAGQFLELRGYKNRDPMPFGATSNIVFSLIGLPEENIRFDPSYDLSGGEDTDFFHRFLATGREIAFAADAVAFETIPESRATFGWIWRRWRRTGQTSASLQLNGAAARGEYYRCFVQGMVRIAAGLVLAVGGSLVSIGTGTPVWAKGLRIAARGFGFVDAATGVLYQDYAAPQR
ncbi:MAG: glycosyltransferase [Pseudomonadota bacterium]